MRTSRFLLFPVLVCLVLGAGEKYGDLIAAESRDPDSLLFDCGSEEYQVREPARKELIERFAGENQAGDTVWLARRLIDWTLDAEKYLVVLRLFNDLTEDRQEQVVSEIAVPDYSSKRLEDWSSQCARGNYADSCRAAYSLLAAAKNPAWGSVLVVRLNTILESGIGFQDSYQIIVQARSRARVAWLNQNPIPEYPVSDAQINSVVDAYLPVFELLLAQRDSVEPLNALSQWLPQYIPVRNEVEKTRKKGVASGFCPLNYQQKDARFYDLLVQPTHRERIKKYLSVLSQREEERKSAKNNGSAPSESSDNPVSNPASNPVSNLNSNPKDAPAGNSDNAGIPVQTDSQIPELPVLNDPEISAENQDMNQPQNAESDDNQNLPARLLIHIDELFKPGLVTEYWQSGVRRSQQFLIVGQPRKEIGALRPSFFDWANADWAHCASGNNLAKEKYRIGIAFEHPNQQDAFFRIVYLPDLRSKLLYTQDNSYSGSNSLAAVSRKTYEYYLERKSILSRKELNLIRYLDPEETLNFYEKYVRIVPDQAFKEGMFGGTGSLHGHLSATLALINVPGAAAAILKADRENRFLPLNDLAKYNFPAIAILSLCSRNRDAAHRKILMDLKSDNRLLFYWKSTDQISDSLLASVLTALPSIGATARGILQSEYHVINRDFEISEHTDLFYQQFGMRVWRKTAP